jgi:hypothetical protein
MIKLNRYKVTVKQTVWHTYIFESGETDANGVADYFYEMEPEEQDAAKHSSESYEWEIDNIELLKPLELKQ